MTPKKTFTILFFASWTISRTWIECIVGKKAQHHEFDFLQAEKARKHDLNFFQAKKAQKQEFNFLQAKEARIQFFAS